MTKSTITKTDIQMILDDDWLLMDDCEGLTPTFMRNHIAVFERYGIAPNDSSTVIQALRIALDGIERRAAMLQAGNCRENANSSTNNFREIAETSTSTAITPAAPDKKLTDDVLDEIIVGAKTSMEQYLALSLKAEREAWRQCQPTDDERIMAIEGIIPGLDEHVRYESNAGGNLWIQCSRHKFEKMKQAGMLTRMLYERPEAGNSPVIPDGWKLVPIDATRSMIDAARRVEEDGYDAMHKAMLAAAPQEVKSE